MDCVRCGALLSKRTTRGVEQAIVLNMTALIVFVLANAFPFITLNLQGRVQNAEIVSAAYALYQDGMWELGILVLLFAIHRLSACGYSLAPPITRPGWDWPWIFPGSDVVAEPNMVFYVHMILMDRESGHALALADTSVVTKTGSERLSHAPLELLVV